MEGRKMQTKEFQEYLSQVDKLTPTQQKTLKDKIRKKCNIQTVENLLNKIDSCPHCKSKKLYKWGLNAGIQRYKCTSCNKTFNSLTNTPLSHLRHKEHWNEFARDLIFGKSIRDSAMHCHIDKSTSFRWRHRFLETVSNVKSHLHGIVEVDETFFLESKKGSYSLKREARQRGSGATKRGLSLQQIPVLIARDRNGNISDAVLQRANEKALIKSLLPLLDKDVLLCSDANNIYKAFTKHFNFEHKSINASKHQYTNGAYHIQNVNAYTSRLKIWIKRFHGVSTKYLEHYLGWMRMLDTNKNISSKKVGTVHNSVSASVIPKIVS